MNFCKKVNILYDSNLRDSSLRKVCKSCRKRTEYRIGSSIKLYFHKKEFNDAPRKFQIRWIFVRNKSS